MAPIPGDRAKSAWQGGLLPTDTTVGRRGWHPFRPAPTPTRNASTGTFLDQEVQISTVQGERQHLFAAQGSGLLAVLNLISYDILDDRCRTRRPQGLRAECAAKLEIQALARPPKQGPEV